MRPATPLTRKIATVIALSTAAITLACVEQSASSTGSSEVVLIDFSKSFAPLTKGDEVALRNLADASAEAAVHSWKAPASILWSPIESSSLLSKAICGPIELRTALVKRADETPASGFATKVQTCASAAMDRSADTSAYTDISGALSLAIDQANASGSEKHIAIFSDFMEDEPQGVEPANTTLSGAHLLLIHRHGLSGRTSLSDHLKNIERWREKLIGHGAESVITLPVGSLTKERAQRALSGGRKQGTDVVILQNLPDSARKDALVPATDAIRLLAQQWPSPVTLTWANVNDGFGAPSQIPPLELVQKLVKPSTSLDPQEQFAIHLSQAAAGMSKYFPGDSNPDLSGTLRLYASGGALDEKHVALVASGFAPQPDPASLPNLAGWTVILAAAPRSSDAHDQQAYVQRVNAWSAALASKGATVCKVPLNNLTVQSIKRCFNEH